MSLFTRLGEEVDAIQEEQGKLPKDPPKSKQEAKVEKERIKALRKKFDSFGLKSWSANIANAMKIRVEFSTNSYYGTYPEGSIDDIFMFRVGDDAYFLVCSSILDDNSIRTTLAYGNRDKVFKEEKKPYGGAVLRYLGKKTEQVVELTTELFTNESEMERLLLEAYTHPTPFHE